MLNSPKEKVTFRNPWSWVPTLYFAQGIPYVIVMFVTVVMYRRLGISNAEIALYTSWLYLPWVIKPLWSPIVDLLKTKRYWIIITQLIVGAGLASVALTIPLPDFFKITIGIFWLMAFASATHDIAADGFYMLSLTKHQQAWFVGVRSTFYRIAMITGQGLLVIIAGAIESRTGLDDVDVVVRANPGIEQARLQSPYDIHISSQPGDVRVIAMPENPELSTKTRSQAEVDSVIQFAREWNIEHGFNVVDIEELEEGGNAVKDEERRSWWNKHITENIEGFIERHFAPREEPELDLDYAGNIGIVFFHLSREPDEEERVLTFGRVRGDHSIELVVGDRMEFTRDNWNTPAMAIIKLDPQLDFATSATFQVRSGNIPLAWSITFFFLAGLFVVFFLYHKFILPYPTTDKPAAGNGDKKISKEFFRTFALFFKKENIGIAIGFLLLYRFAEAQIVRLASPFLLDPQEIGGLALTTGQVGIVYGTVGLIALSIGGILGGILAARNGLKYWLWPMVMAITLPNLVFVYLSQTLPDNLLIINAAIAVEQFGYGFGFTAYMLFMIYISEGEHKTAHYAICTGFMALGMMIPGMFSGWLQEIIGYQHFFIWVVLATIPTYIVASFIKIDPEFGKKKPDEEERKE